MNYFRIIHCLFCLVRAICAFALSVVRGSHSFLLRLGEWIDHHRAFIRGEETIFFIKCHGLCATGKSCGIKSSDK